jgi:hypothetical protein
LLARDPVFVLDQASENVAVTANSSCIWPAKNRKE